MRFDLKGTPEPIQRYQCLGCINRRHVDCFESQICFYAGSTSDGCRKYTPDIWWNGFNTECLFIGVPYFFSNALYHRSNILIEYIIYNSYSNFSKHHEKLEGIVKYRNAYEDTFLKVTSPTSNIIILIVILEDCMDKIVGFEVPRKNIDSTEEFYTKYYQKYIERAHNRNRAIEQKNEENYSSHGERIANNINLLEKEDR